MESEADRLASIKALGGVRVRTDAGQSHALFDNVHIEGVSPTGMGLSDTAPQLTMTAAEALRLGLKTKGAVVFVQESCGEETRFTVRDPRPAQPGWSTLILDTYQ